MPLDRETVLQYARLYERRAAGTSDERVEQELWRWFADHRFLDNPHFVQLGRWKSARQTHNYESNAASVIEETTRRAIGVEASEQQRVEFLCELNGVDYMALGVTDLADAVMTANQSTTVEGARATAGENQYFRSSRIANAASASATCQKAQGG